MGEVAAPATGALGSVAEMDRMEWLYLVGIAVVLAFGFGVVLRNRRGTAQPTATPPVTPSVTPPVAHGAEQSTGDEAVAVLEPVTDTDVENSGPTVVLRPSAKG